MSALGRIAGALKPSANVVNDIGSGASDIIKTGVRKGTSPVSVAGVGAAGAYSYGQYSDIQESDDRTDRYEQYQNRLAEIEDRYARGDISKQEMEAMKEQAREDFYASNDENADNRGLSFTEFLAQLGTIQLATLAGLATAGLYFVGKPLAGAVAENDMSLESLLG